MAAASCVEEFLQQPPLAKHTMEQPQCSSYNFLQSISSMASCFPCPFTVDPHMSIELRCRLITLQVEYYFSIDNLCKDLYLRSQMDSRGFVALDEIAKFNRMKLMLSQRYPPMSIKDKAVVDALRSSQVLQIDRTRSKVRRREGWINWLPPTWLVPNKTNPDAEDGSRQYCNGRFPPEASSQEDFRQQKPRGQLVIGSFVIDEDQISLFDQYCDVNASVTLTYTSESSRTNMADDDVAMTCDTENNDNDHKATASQATSVNGKIDHPWPIIEKNKTSTRYHVSVTQSEASNSIVINTEAVGGLVGGIRKKEKSKTKSKKKKKQKRKGGGNAEQQQGMHTDDDNQSRMIGICNEIEEESQQSMSASSSTDNEELERNIVPTPTTELTTIAIEQDTCERRAAAKLATDNDESSEKKAPAAVEKKKKNRCKTPNKKGSNMESGGSTCVASDGRADGDITRIAAHAESAGHILSVSGVSQRSTMIRMKSTVIVFCFGTLLLFLSFLF